MNEEGNFIEQISKIIRKSIMLKLVTITVLMLLLLIPTAMIQDIIEERERLSEEVITEVSSKWAGWQLINGPVLTIPAVYEYKENGKLVRKILHYHLLPEKLNILGKIDPETLKRGIYEVVVYKSSLKLSGSFILVTILDEDNLQEIQFDKAFLTIGISDLRGIEEEIALKWGDHELGVTPGSKIPDLVRSGITIMLPDLEGQINKNIDFSLDLKLQGSQNMSFTPLGKITNVRVESSWADPSFNGNFLPDERMVDEQGFSATWNILQLNRNFPQYWTGNRQWELDRAAFGFDLILPIDDYKKSIRSAKYGAMTIAFTFLIFFLVEILNQRKIHPFQYALVGLALCLFYVLLVSISEHSNFQFAYLISAISIITIIVGYSISVFKARKLTTLMGLFLILVYGFVYVTLQLTDYALLIGSIGLAIMLAATMYFTRKVNWYRLNITTEQ